MKIFTSYFGRMKKMPAGYVPIAICGRVKFPYGGLRYPKLAPTASLFSAWKENHDNDFYIQNYNKDVLSNLEPANVRHDIEELAGVAAEAAVLMCYETPDKFCHRHLVARWLGDDVVEWNG